MTAVDEAPWLMWPNDLINVMTGQLRSLVTIIDRQWRPATKAIVMTMWWLMDNDNDGIAVLPMKPYSHLFHYYCY